MENPIIVEYVRDFILDDIDWGDIKSYKSLLGIAISCLDANLREEFDIKFSDLEGSLQDEFANNAKEEWESFLENN
jgi:hypothetical protein